MKIILNGIGTELDSPVNLGRLIDLYDMKRETVVVEVNGDLPDKSDYETIMTKDGDVIELIRFVGGG